MGGGRGLNGGGVGVMGIVVMIVCCLIGDVEVVLVLRVSSVIVVSVMRCFGLIICLEVLILGGGVFLCSFV